MSEAQDDSEADALKPLQIGEVAARTNLSIRTIRHWEEVGLLRPSARSRGGFRLYSEEDVARLRLLRFMKPLNFSLEQMRELLELRADAVQFASGAQQDLSSALVWPRSSHVDDSAIAQRLSRNLEHYAEQAQRRLEKLRQQVTEVEEFVERLRDEATRGPLT
ncbi:MerR family transcriptional regulator [Nakamurella sp. GG22]